ncbi:MAG TPA: hypothetical protein PLA80_13305, partial [Synergistaceae bacterium]|nr:hypothetical protein [Synergistaceae bacterium]
KLKPPAAPLILTSFYGYILMSIMSTKKPWGQKPLKFFERAALKKYRTVTLATRIPYSERWNSGEQVFPHDTLSETPRFVVAGT